MTGTEQSADGAMAGRAGSLNRSGLLASGLVERPGRRWDTCCLSWSIMICRSGMPIRAGLAVIPDGDPDHCSTATGAWPRGGDRLHCGFGTKFSFLRLVGQQCSARREAGSALSVGEKAVMADAVKAIRQGMKKQAAPCHLPCRPDVNWRWRHDGYTGSDRPAPVPARRWAAWRRVEDAPPAR